MRLHDSLSRGLSLLPAPPDPIGLYVCGVTPYDHPHLGHARAAVVFDALVRWLRHRGRTVTYVRNITDIDDKIIARAIAMGANATGAPDILSFTEPFIASYQQMCADLGCLPPDHEPRVSEHIPQILALIERLFDAGIAYEAAGSVYFSVRKFPSYGRLSGRSLDDLIAGARVEPGEEKRDGLDFALWKAAKPGEPQWASPWGPGRPGWHIECSAMSMHYLGETFALHGGGLDLLFPHHENERAQSEAATGRTYASSWIHNGLVTLGERKMSKSDGNVVGIPELLARHGATVLRYYLLAVHFASPLDASPERFEEACAALDRFATLGGNPNAAGARDHALYDETVAAVRAGLDENFNTPRAFAALFEAVREANRAPEGERQAARDAAACAASDAGRWIGLELLPAPQDDAEIDRLVADRNAARAARDFARSDALRKELADRGIIIEDTPQGTRWRR